ncbi:MAG: FAD-binding protein [Gammaproteobacteria bacterium]|nr:FAD-binding protein [Gammaproteobacteria bacterium]
MSFEARLAAVLPPGALLTSEEAKRPYECDALSAYHELPRVVVVPETRAQVEQVVKLCREFDVPVVTRGAGTGLSGGALPLAQGCLLSLARFNRILAVDVDNRTATVEPGVRNLAISEAVAPHGLYYAPDPSSQIACTIGGNVAENSGGVHCLKYGLTVHNVLEVEVLTIDGEWLTLGGRGLDAPGLDLLALMHGSEGLLGIVMQVTVKLLPKPELARVVLAAFDSVEAAGAAVAAIIAAGIVPGGLEMMDKLAIEVAEAYCHAGYPLDAAAILLCEVDGNAVDVDAQLEQVGAVLREAGARDLRVSRDEAERLRFWLGRKSAFPAIGRIAPDYFCMDGTIPRRHLAPVLERIAALSREFNLPVANVFHAGDGNLHPLIAFDANDDDSLRRAALLGGRILAACVEVGGTVTGEHGVGVEKLNEMCLQFTDAELDTFLALKAAFDPKGLLNPGKAVPTLHRCAEFGAMHVKGGKLPHPELERF